MGFLVFLLVAVVSSTPCSDLPLHHEFTECNDNIRKVVFYRDQACEGDPTPPPVSVPCNFTCPSGYYLELNYPTLQLQCSQCPSNSFSIGGGKRWDKGSWIDFESDIISDCWTSEALMWNKGKNCTTWTTDGSILESGTTSLKAWLNDRLLINTHLVMNGTVTIKYQKDTRMRSWYHNGEFIVVINGVTVLSDIDLAHKKWNTKTFNVRKGPLEIEIAYVKYSSPDYDDLKSVIEFLEIRGTDYAARKCSPCLHSYSEPGSDSCELCSAGTYLDNNECLNCPPGHYSPKGSSGIESCVQRHPCTTDDYSEKYSKCTNSTRNLYYAWNVPTICDTVTGVSLPESITDLPCEVCSPGQYHALQPDDTSECKPCPDGTALIEAGFASECAACQAGYFAPKILNYTGWSSIPQEFVNDCKPFNGDDCSKSHGWIPSSSFLSTGTNADLQADIELTTHVNIIETDGDVQFEYSVEQNVASESKLWFFIDGILYGAFGETEEKTLAGPYALQRGNRILRWQFHRDSPSTGSDLAKLYSIQVKGSSRGGGIECIQCKAGYISYDRSESCEPCMPGMTSNSNNTQCIPCTDDYYNDRPGQTCSPCPSGTYANSQKKACIGQPLLYLAAGSHFIGNITGAQLGKEGYSEGICAKPNMEMFCHDTFYGPLPGNNNYFYVSVLNPSNFSLPSYGSFDDNHFGYAFAVLDKKLMYWSNYQPSDTCAENSDKIIVNLGSKIEDISATDEGFNIKYMNGSRCSNTQYTSEVQFMCDKDSGEGWPVYQGMVGCFFVFRWKSRYACKLCEATDYTEIRGKCDDGKRLVQLVESNSCVSLDSNLHWTESCSVTKEFMETWPFIIGCVLTGVLVIVAIVALCACRKFKRKYELLSEDPSGNKPNEEF
mmetsp:Transcript_1213/g.2985  ORF Transcript_1213/g.2985 Transcript_1213/m.2985 type:complete len:889 (-) Transcript_1213:2048-4714(-)